MDQSGHWSHADEEQQGQMHKILEEGGASNACYANVNTERGA